MPHRRVIKQAMEKIMASKEVKGARIEISGRLGGSEIARREWLKKGRLPRQTLRSIIDYKQSEAFCTYGVIGVKVWIYKGEKFD
ncbi:30S ribosomal protein S3 [subsurface metagenome]